MTAQRTVYVFTHHPVYSDGRYHGPDIDLRTHLEPLFEKYGVNVVFPWPRLRVPAIDAGAQNLLFRARQFGRVAISQLEGFAGDDTGFEPIAVLWWWKSPATSSISRRFRERDRWWIRASWIGLKGETRSSFASFRERFCFGQAELHRVAV